MRTKSLHLLGRLAALGAVAVATTWANDAAAATECGSLQHPLVVVGSSAVKPFMTLLGPALAAQSSPISLIYQSPGSCAGQDAYFGAGTTTGTGLTVYDAQGTSGLTCDITAAEGLAIDIAISDVFDATCPNSEAPSGVKDFHGPVQSMVFAVSKASSRQLISYEAAYLTFGLGADGGTYWNDVADIFVRDQNSGTQQMIAKAIDVPAARFQGTSGNGTAIQTGLGNAASNQELADGTIGILGMDVVRKPSVGAVGDYVPLAYQHLGQTAAYYPSSDFASNDMQNTRDGHYAIQGPVHMFTKVNGSGVPTKADAKTFIDYMTGAVIPSSFDLVKLEASISIVPDCAMRVTRDAEIGAFMSYMPDVSCECKFLFEVGADVPAECGSCDAANNDDHGVNTQECPKSRQHCNYGFCEVQ